jgi:hypothetical protein
MRRRLLAGMLVVAAVASGAAGVVAGAGKRDRGPKPSVFVAPSGSDQNRCRERARPCASFARAYEAARPGEVVEVAGGSYPRQEILADPRKRSSKHVVFRPARGARPTVRELALGNPDGNGPRHLTITGIATAYASRTHQMPVSALPGTRDVVLRNLDAGNFNLWGVQDLKILGGDWGPCYAGVDEPCGNSRIDAGPPGFETRNVLVDGVLVHGYRYGQSCWDTGGCHHECVYLNGSHDVTIRNSRFRDCALYDIFVTLSGPDAARVGHRRLTIENNWFDTPWDESGPTTTRRARASALALNWCQNSPHGYKDVRIRNNSFQRNTGFLLDPNPECRFENIRVVGNLLAWDGCDSRWSYDYNVWSTGLRRGRCSPTDRIAGDAFPYRNAASGPGFDFRLKDDWKPARDLVPAAACAARDIDGRRRDGKRCDAGSSESD